MYYTIAIIFIVCSLHLFLLRWLFKKEELNEKKHQRWIWIIYNLCSDQKKWKAVVIDHFPCRLIFLLGSCTPFKREFFGCIKCPFHIDVTFEMRTVHYQNVFIQLMILALDPVSLISKWKRGQEDKIAERLRESEGERTSVGWGRMQRQSWNRLLENKHVLATFGRIVIN